MQEVDHIALAKSMGNILDNKERMKFLNTIPKPHQNLVFNLMPIFLSVTIADIKDKMGRREALFSIPEDLLFASNSSTVQSFVKARVIHIFKLRHARSF